MADTKFKKFIWFGWKLVLGGFWGLWLQIFTQNSEIKYSRANMADQNVTTTWLDWKRPASVPAILIFEILRKNS